MVRANLKKRMKEDERLAEIEAENARLLSSMAKIYESPDTMTRLKKPPVCMYVCMYVSIYVLCL